MKPPESNVRLHNVCLQSVRINGNRVLQSCQAIIPSKAIKKLKTKSEFGKINKTRFIISYEMHIDFFVNLCYNIKVILIYILWKMHKILSTFHCVIYFVQSVDCHVNSA